VERRRIGCSGGEKNGSRAFVPLTVVVSVLLSSSSSPFLPVHVAVMPVVVYICGSPSTTLPPYHHLAHIYSFSRVDEKNPRTALYYQERELSNGRLAMVSEY